MQDKDESINGESEPSLSAKEAWARWRGAMKDVFAEYGGGEAYLRAEREEFNRPREGE